MTIAALTSNAFSFLNLTLYNHALEPKKLKLLINARSSFHKHIYKADEEKEGK